MCGRFTLFELPAVAQRLGLQLLLDDALARARFNVAPSQEIPVITQEEDDRALRWIEGGFRPGWFTPKPGQPPPTNARAEALLERPMFRGDVAAHRRSIPANGFYEWPAVPGQHRK